MLIPYSLRHASPTFTWLFNAVDEDERQHAGNDGYDDDVRAVYRYDSFVSNCRKVREGDLALIRNNDELLGIARVERIAVEQGTKTLYRCPECTKTTLKPRKLVQPRFRCYACAAVTDAPTVSIEPCTKYAARFGNSFVATPRAVSDAELRAACERYNPQHAIQRISLQTIHEKLLAIPNTEALLGTRLRSNSRQWLLVASAEHVDARPNLWPVPTHAPAGVGHSVTLIRVDAPGATIVAQGKIDRAPFLLIGDESDEPWWRLPRHEQRDFLPKRYWVSFTWTEQALSEPFDVLGTVDWDRGEPPLWCLLESSSSRGAPDERVLAESVVVEIPVERMRVRASSRNVEAGAVTAVRRETEMVHRFEEALRVRGMTLVRHMIAVPGTTVQLFTDLYVKEQNLLVEAKHTDTREGVRMAFAQLLDYRRFFDPQPNCAVLLPVRPPKDLEVLLAAHDVQVFWEDAEGTFRRAPDGALLDLSPASPTCS